jgi:hypothetical protein
MHRSGERAKNQLSSMLKNCNIGEDGIQAGRPGFDSQQCKSFLFSTASRPTPGPTQPPIQLLSRALSPWIKRPGHGADHSPPTSAEVKTSGAIPPLPPEGLSPRRGGRA